MPTRRDLDPTEIPLLLPYVVLVDVLSHEPLDLRFRLVGTAVRARSHQDLTGRRLAEVPHMREGRLWRDYATVVRTRRPYGAPVEYAGPDRHVRRAEHLLMPLGAGETAIDMVFAIVDYDRS
jgi:hypothetical protein